jgi:hypothetical protein
MEQYLLRFLHYRLTAAMHVTDASTGGVKMTAGNQMNTEMGRQVAVVLYVVAMAAVIVGVDFVFFRNRFWERLTVNIGIVLVFAAFYLRFLRRP